MIRTVLRSRAVFYGGLGGVLYLLGLSVWVLAH